MHVLSCIALVLAGSVHAAPVTLPANLSLRPALPGLTARASMKGSSLRVSLAPPPSGLSRVTLHFSGAGVAASGGSYLPGTGNTGHSWEASPQQLTLTLTPDGLPPFPVKGPLVAELCLVLEPSDGQSLHCATFALPASVRQGAPKPGPGIVALHRKGRFWVGSNEQGNAVWLHSPEPLTEERLSRAVTDSPTQLEGFYVSPTLTAPSGDALVPVFSGPSAFSAEACDASHEVRLMLWAIRGKTALKVFDWPAASCELGRGISLTAEEGGGLSLAYAGGNVVRFTWVGDHYERTELGERPGSLPASSGHASRNP